MNKIDFYRSQLRDLTDWDEFLLTHSGLPGPRGNLELAHAVAMEGTLEQFQRWLKYDAQTAPVNSPREFLAFCGVRGLGKILAQGNDTVLPVLREFASDPRWRTREAVAMALQHWGRSNPVALLAEMRRWAQGNCYEQRAVAAALCEPDLLHPPTFVEQVLQLLDDITSSILSVDDRRQEAFKALRKGLGYCWSVAMVACPAQGKPLLEKWAYVTDPDIRWIVKENLQKKRLIRMDGVWVDQVKNVVKNI